MQTTVYTIEGWKMSLKDQVLFPIRIDKPLQDELARISELLGLTKSQVVRCSIRLSIEKPSEVERIMKEIEAQTDAWYERKDSNNGEKEAVEKAEKLKKILMEP